MANVGIEFESDSFKTFNKQLNIFIKISNKVDTNLAKIGTTFNRAEKSVNSFNSSFGKTVHNFSKLKGAISLGNSAGGSGVGGFTKSLNNLTSTMTKMQAVNLQPEKIHDFANSVKEMFKIFAGTKRKFSIFPLKFKKSQSGLLDMIDKFSNVNVGKLKNLSNSMRDFAATISTISSINIEKFDIEGTKKVFKGLLEIFTGKKRKFFVFPLKFKRGEKGIFQTIEKISSIDVSKLSSFSKSLLAFTKSLSDLNKIKIDSSQMKQVKTAFQSLFDIFGGGKRFGIFGKGGILKQLDKVKNISKLAELGTAISRFATTIGKIDRVSLGKGGIKEFASQVNEILKVVIKITNSRGFKKINTKTLDSVSKFAKSMSKILPKSLGTGGIKNMEKVGEQMGDATIDGLKKSFEMRSPSRVMMRMGKDVAKGFAMGLKTGFGAIKGLVKGLVSPITAPLNFIRKRFVLTFGDMQRIARGAFRAIIGTTIAFESAFTGVMKTIDTSSIFAKGGQGAVDAFTAGLEQDLLALTTDADSLVAGLEDGFVTLSRIAELGGQLGIEATGIADFANVIGQLTLASDLTEDAGAFFLAKFTSITGTKNFEQLGGAIVNLGNNLAVTESQIAATAQRIVAAGTAAGLSESQILGWSAAMRASGLNAEAGSTSFIQFTSQIAKSVASGDARIFADQMGLTNKEFIELFENDPNAVFEGLIGSLGQLSRTEMIQFAEAAGLSGIRLDQFIQSLSLAEKNSGTLTNALALADEGMVEFGDSTETYNALQEESSRRMKDTSSKLNRMRNSFKSLSNTFGKLIQPAFNRVVDTITKMVIGLDSFFKKLSDVTGLMEEITGINKDQSDELRDQIELQDELGAATEETQQSVITHTFEYGDTLSALADEYGVTVDEILEANNATLEQFQNGLSEVKIPIKGVATELQGVVVEVDEVGSSLSGLGGSDFATLLITQTDAMTESTKSLKENLGGVKEGLLQMASGDVTSGLQTVRDSLSGVKDDARSIMELFLGRKKSEFVDEGGFGITANVLGSGSLDELDKSTKVELSELLTMRGAMSIDFSQESFIDLLLGTFEELFGADLSPVTDFISDNLGLIIGAAFAILTGGSFALAIPVATFLVDVLGVNFGSIEEALEGSPLLQHMIEFAESMFNMALSRTVDLSNVVLDFVGLGDFGAEMGTISEEAFMSGDEGIFTQIETRSTDFGERIKEFVLGLVGDIGTAIGALGSLAAEFLIEGLILLFDNIDKLPDLIIGIGAFAVEVAFAFMEGFIDAIEVDEDQSGRLRKSMGEGLETALTDEAFLADMASLFTGTTTDLEIGIEITTEFFDDLERAIDTIIVGVGDALKGLTRELKFFFEVMMIDLQIGINQALNLIPGIDLSNTALEEKKNELQGVRQLQRDIAKGRVEGGGQGLGAFVNLGGDIDDIEGSVASINERFALGLDPEMVSNMVDLYITDTEEKIRSGELSIDDAIDDLIHKGFGLERVKALIGENLGIGGALDELAGSEVLGDLQLNNLITQSLVGTTDFDTGLGELGLGSLGELMGASTGEGLLAGISTALEEQSLPGSEFSNSIGNLGSATELQLKSAFEIDSPSKMTQRIGSDLVSGIAKGMQDTLVLLNQPVSLIINKLVKVGSAFENIAIAIRMVKEELKGSTLSLSGVAAAAPGGRRFGGPVVAGGIYEVLEGDLPFELFRTQNKTFFLPNENGTVISPLGQSGTVNGSSAAANSVNTNNIVNNSGGGISITVPITFQTVPSDVSDAELNNISDVIATTVTDRISDAVKENTLNDRLNQTGRL